MPDAVKVNRLVALPTLRPGPMMLLAFVGSAAAGGHDPARPLVRVISESAGATPALLEDPEPNRELAWQLFLEQHTEPEGPFAAAQVVTARRLWRTVSRVVQRELPLPSTRESEEGSLLMVWDTPKALIEAEVLADGALEWFARDRETGTYVGTNEDRLRHVPRALIERLEQAFA